jgi:DNA-binding response OmpR family regulator
MALLNLRLMKKALSFGYLKKIKEEREQHLEQAGIEVTPAASVAETIAMLRESTFDVLIVGPTVPQEERDRVAAFAKSRRARVIFLYKNYIKGAESGDALISVDGSPDDLIEAVNALTA